MILNHIVEWILMFVLKIKISRGKRLFLEKKVPIIHKSVELGLMP